MSAALPPPDERNPLARALDASSEGPEARAYAVPVEAVRAGARRRRARRAGGTAVAAVVVVGAVVGGSALAGLPRGGAPALPGPGESGGSVADWPAQFDRCGEPVDQVLPDLGAPMTLTLADASATVPADRAWTASVTADLQGSDEGFVAMVWATELSLVRDGVVVGVQDGPTAPDLALSLADRLGDNGFPTSPFPIATDVTLALASCDPYPSGQGSPDLVPGTYDLVVTQTLSYVPTVPGQDAVVVQTVTDARVSTRTTVKVTAPAGSGMDDPTACGADADTLAGLADPRLNPAPLVASLDPHSVPYDYSNLPFTPMLHNTGNESLSGTVDRATFVLTRDGVVVGTSAVGPPESGSTFTGLGPGRSLSFPDPPQAAPCDGSTAFVPGDYRAQVVIAGVLDGPAVQAFSMASVPEAWPVTTDTADVPAAPNSLLAPLATCGAPLDEIARLADPGSNPWVRPVEWSIEGRAVVGQPLGTYVLTGDWTDLGDSWALTDGLLVYAKGGEIVGWSGSYPQSGGGVGLFEPGRAEDCRDKAAPPASSAGADRTVGPAPDDLAAGAYDAWLLVQLAHVGPDQEEATVAFGPYPVTIES